MLIAYTIIYWCHGSVLSLPQQEQAAHLTDDLPACHMTCSVSALHTFVGLKDLLLPSYYYGLCS